MQVEKEQDIQKAIIDYLRMKKFIIFKHHSTGTTVRNGQTVFLKYGERGISDIVGCSPSGQFVAVEVKRRGGKPTPEQLEFIQRVNASGGKAIIAFSLDDAMQVF